MIGITSLFRFFIKSNGFTNIIFKFYIRGIKWISNMRKVGY